MHKILMRSGHVLPGGCRQPHADPHMMRSLIGGGIRVKGSPQKRQADGILPSAETVFAVAHHHHCPVPGRRLLAHEACTRHILRQRAPLLHPKGHRAEIGFAAARKGNGEIQLRHAVRAISQFMPFHRHVKGQRAASLFQGYRCFQGRLAKGDLINCLLPQHSGRPFQQLHRSLPVQVMDLHPLAHPPGGHLLHRVLPDQPEGTGGLLDMLFSGFLIHKGNQFHGISVKYRFHQLILHHQRQIREMIQPGILCRGIGIGGPFLMKPFFLLLLQNKGSIAQAFHLSVKENRMVTVAPVVGSLLHHLAVHRISLLIFRGQQTGISLPVPENRADHAPPGMGKGIESGHNPRGPGCAFRVTGHITVSVLHAETGAGAEGTGGFLRGAQGTGIHPGADAPHGVVQIDLGCRHGSLKFTQRVFPGLQYAGTGKNIVELVEQNFLPGASEIRSGTVIRRQMASHGVQGLRLIQPVLPDPVGPFDSGLGSITSGENIVQFLLHHRQLISDLFKLREKFPHGSETDFGHQRPALHLDPPADISSGGSAAVISHSVKFQGSGQSVFSAETRHITQAVILHHLVVVPHRLPVHQHLGAGGRSPPVHMFSVVSPTVIIVFHAALV